jgi:hypothetical protein
MNIAFVHKILDETKQLCFEEQLAPSTMSKKIRFLEKIFGN